MESKETIYLNLEINVVRKTILFREENCSAEEYEYENLNDLGECVAEYLEQNFRKIL